MHTEDIDIVLKVMYPHAQYNEPIPVKHGHKYKYKGAINAAIRAMNKLRYVSKKTIDALIQSIYNFDIANPEYIEPHVYSLEELIPLFAEFAINKKIVTTPPNELISIGRPIKFKSFYDGWACMLAIINLFRYNDNELHDAITAKFTYDPTSNINYNETYLARFIEDPRFISIARNKIVKRNIHVKTVIAVIYQQLLERIIRV